MKLAFVSALAFAATQGVNAQMTAPGWAQEQNNATVQHAGPGMGATDRFFSQDEVLLFEITSLNGTTENYTYNVKVVGVNKEKVSGLTALTILFSDYDEANGPITSKIDAVEAIDVYEPSAMRTKVTGVSLAGITKLTVGITAPDVNTSDHLSPYSTGITSISDNAFANLTGLTEVISYCTTPPTMTKEAFDNSVYGSARVPKAKLSVAPSEDGIIAGKFANAAGWENFRRLYTVGDTYCFGDFNSDGTPNGIDVTELAKYASSRNRQKFIENASYTVNLHSTNIDGKGTVNGTDVTVLAKMIAAGKRAK